MYAKALSNAVRATRRTLGTSTRAFNWNTVWKMSPINAQVQSHLKSVYAILIMMMAAAVFGVSVDRTYHISGFATLTACFLSILIVRFTHPPRSDQRSTEEVANEHYRVVLVILIGFLQGVGVARFVSFVIDIDPRIISSALSLTVAVFACFSLSAMLARRRSLLYLGALLGVASMLLFFGAVVNLYLRSAVLFNLQMYVGAMVFSVYVAFDTQMIIERASQGDCDYAFHALNLFIDFVLLFVRILAILSGGRRKSSNKTS